MKSRFPGRGDPEPCHIRGPLLCEGFMEPWGAAAAASPPHRSQSGLWRLRAKGQRPAFRIPGKTGSGGQRINDTRSCPYTKSRPGKSGL